MCKFFMIYHNQYLLVIILYTSVVDGLIIWTFFYKKNNAHKNQCENLFSSEKQGFKTDAIFKSETLPLNK